MCLEVGKGRSILFVCQVLSQWPCGYLLYGGRGRLASSGVAPRSLLEAVGSPWVCVWGGVSDWLPTRLPARASEIINHIMHSVRLCLRGRQVIRRPRLRKESKTLGVEGRPRKTAGTGSMPLPHKEGRLKEEAGAGFP